LQIDVAIAALAFDLVPVKTLRIWLLVLLCVLLPIRGAVAAVMMSPAAPAAGAGESVVPTMSSDHHGELPGSAPDVGAPVVPATVADAPDETAPHHDHHADPVDNASPADGGCHLASHGDKCTACCDICSLTPLLGTSPVVAVSMRLTSVSFPDLFAPAPSFLSDGQERPPRSN
jgi:hypothetical protein